MKEDREGESRYPGVGALTHPHTGVFPLDRKDCSRRRELSSEAVNTRGEVRKYRCNADCKSEKGESAEPGKTAFGLSNALAGGDCCFISRQGEKLHLKFPWMEKLATRSKKYGRYMFRCLRFLPPPLAYNILLSLSPEKGSNLIVLYKRRRLSLQNIQINI